MSIVWKKNCPNFLYALGEVRLTILPFIPDCFSFIINAINFFIYSLNGFVLKKKKKKAYALLVFFNQVPYMQLSHMIPRVNILSRKVILASINRVGGSGGVLRPQQGRRKTPKKIFSL